MKLKFYKKGSDLTAYAIELDDGTCPVEDFLRALEDDKKRRAYGERIVSTLDLLLNNRAFRNPDLIEPIQGYDNLLAITPNKVRVLMGYAPGGIVLLSVGYMKNEVPGKAANPYYERADSLQRQVVDRFFKVEKKKNAGKTGKQQSRGSSRDNRTKAGCTRRA